VQVAEEAPQGTNVVDLLEVLRRSVDSARGGGRAASTATKAGPGRATKSAATKRPAAEAATKTSKAAAKKASAKKTAAKKSAGSTSRTARKAT
jgi:DNA end-binding protein Ku